MVFMPAETQGKNRKLTFSFYGSYWIMEVRTNTLLVSPVDEPTEQPIHVNMDRAVWCEKKLQDTLST